ncbi:hypothetical protein FB45DRAFT_939676 [Roridomyces roridus]|uniref:Uncharacterized protein n=1 Tax=Roridomyces roridus TaxID=1738132 RepID=A0AAD7B7C4_9AGAR|nr:hypothetical protein FB45DRAFT_939676 [Roridomyces roridus]
MSSFSPVLLIRAQCTCREPGVVKSRAVDLPQVVHRRRKDVCELSKPCASTLLALFSFSACSCRRSDIPHSVSDIRAHSVLVVERVVVDSCLTLIPADSTRRFRSGSLMSPTTTTLIVVLPSRFRSGVAWMHAGRRKGQRRKGQGRPRHVGWLDGLGGLGCVVWTTGRVYCI